MDITSIKRQKASTYGFSGKKVKLSAEDETRLSELKLFLEISEATIAAVRKFSPDEDKLIDLYRKWLALFLGHK